MGNYRRTILSAVDKTSIKTDKKVGEEATDVNLDLTVKGSATYYNKDNLNEKVKELLKKKAEDESCLIMRMILI